MIQKLLDIALPIIQAPMAGVQGSALALAVSNAGGLGSLPCAMLDAENLQNELDAIRKNTDRPFNINFFCHRLPDPDPSREAQWRQALTPYYKEFGIDERSLVDAPVRQPISHDVADMVEPFSPPVVSFHFGLPDADLLQRVRSWGSKIISTATTVEEARWLESRGVDAIVAQGLEAGGHRGHFLSADLNMQMGTLALVPQIVQAVEVPVIAAGGIADERIVAAAMRLGAAGVQIGTSYLLCDECKTGELHRRALQGEMATVTALTNVFSGRPARGIVNRLMRELGPTSTVAPEFPFASNALTPLRSAAEKLDKNDFTPLWCGQNSCGCKQIDAAELTRQLASLIIDDY